MSGFGDKLRREREMRGVSLEEIAESTKIGTRSLRALEDDDFDKLPGGIFNKGFVRAYSHFLGLDEDQTVADFDAALKEYRAAKGQPEEIQTHEEPEPASSGYAWLLLASILLLILALAGGWYVVKYRHRAKAGTAQMLAGDRAVSPSPIAAADSPAASDSPAKSAKPGQAPTHDNTSVPNSSSSPPPARNQSESGNLRANTAPIQLRIFAREDSWLSVFADGKNLGQATLGAQKTRTVLAQNEVRLRVGNVGGVEVFFNGKPVNIGGEPKQVKELTFTPSGLRQ